jgi:hypothetical protein
MERTKAISFRAFISVKMFNLPLEVCGGDLGPNPV